MNAFMLFCASVGGSCLSPTKGISFVLSKQCINTIYDFLFHYWNILQKKSKMSHNPTVLQHCDRHRCMGGHRPSAIPYSAIKTFLDNSQLEFEPCSSFLFIDYVLADSDDSKQFTDSCYIFIDMPLDVLVSQVTVTIACKIAGLHGIKPGSRANLMLLKAHLAEHKCDRCKQYSTILAIKPEKSVEKKHESNNIYARRYRYGKKALKCKQNGGLTEMVKDGSIDIDDTLSDLSNLFDKPSNEDGKYASKSVAEVEIVHDNKDAFPPDPLDKQVAHTIIRGGRW